MYALRNTKHDHLLSLRLEERKNGAALRLVRGSSAIPVFESVALPPYASEPIDIKLEHLKGGLSINGIPTSNSTKKRKRQVVLGPDNEGEEILIQGVGIPGRFEQSELNQIDASPDNVAANNSNSVAVVSGRIATCLFIVSLV